LIILVPWRRAITNAGGTAGFLQEAGEAVLAGFGQRVVGGFNVGLFLVSLAELINALVLLEPGPFGRPLGRLGQAAFGLPLLDCVHQADTSSVPMALLVILPNAILLMIWFGRVGTRLIRWGGAGRNYTQG